MVLMLTSAALSRFLAVSIIESELQVGSDHFSVQITVVTIPRKRPSSDTFNTRDINLSTAI